jgi:hypothetical protein
MRLKKEGSRGRRVAVAGALAATAMMAFGASSAFAVSKPLDITLDDAALTLPITGTSDVLDPPNTAHITGTIDDATGAITAGDLTFPSFTGTASGVPVRVDFDNNGPLTGTLNPANGNLSITAANYTSVVQLNPPTGTTCTYDPINVSFSSVGGTPIAGAPFTINNAGATQTATHGIVSAVWDNNDFPSGDPNPPTGDCSLIDSIVHGGNGQLALGNGFDLTPAATPPPDSGGGTVAPPPAKKKKCKKAKKGSASAAKKSKCKKKKK